MPEDYLRKVQRFSKDALVQTGAVRRCEQHKDVLIHNPEYKDIHVPYNLASIWLKHEDIVPMREDLQDAIQGILDGAARDVCPECARQKEN